MIDSAERPVPASALESVVGALSRRGPDARDVWREGPCTLVHCRLRVIDTSSSADQPMIRDASERVVMVYNGEIYNYRALQAQLQDSGWKFETRSDAEVLLAGYLAWGREVFRRARGMWAAAFWHPRERRLTLTRDPLGKKPLVYSARDGRLAFASTVTALLPLLDTVPALDPTAVDCFLGHLVVPFEHSIFSGIEKVPPGTTVTWTPGSAPRFERFWEPPSPQRTTPSDPVGEVEQLLRQGVRRRLTSDVPLGLFLSAGFDSGLVAAIAAQESGRPLVAVTAGTDGSSSDERSAAGLIAQRYGLDHRPINVPAVSASVLPKLIAELGEPFGDSSLLPSYFVAQAARSEITVALTGDGGDECFYGYSMFQGVRFAQMYRRLLPASARRALWRLTRGATTGAMRRVAALCEYGAAPLPASYRNRMGFASGDREALLAPVGPLGGHIAEHIYADRLRPLSGLTDAEAFRQMLFETFLPNDYLTKVDTATMAASLEARCPFLDIDLVEYALRLPSDVAFKGGRLKVLLRPLVRRLLPDRIARRAKTGFAVPIDRWLRTGLRPALEEFVFRSGTFLSSFLDRAVARRVADEHQRGADHGTRLWALLCLGVWAAVVVERRLAPSDPLPMSDGVVHSV